MGRDMTVLQQWQLTGKPPLLGPQTSALPFNQSAIYFYLLYPGYLISSGNPVANVYSLAIFYIIFLIIGFYALRKDKLLLIAYLVSFFLLSIHPQYITQGRFVWNPSFVTPLIITAIFAFYKLLNQYSRKTVTIFSLCIATAVSISYSVAPLLISLFIFWLLFNRKHFSELFIGLAGSFFIVQLPTIFFELRHKFVLTKLLLTNKSPEQEGLLFSTRVDRLSQFIFSTTNQQLNIILFVASVIVAIIVVYKFRNIRNKLQFLAAFLYLSLTALAFITPVSIQSHYIFGFTSLLFILIAALSPRLSLPVLLFFTYLYCQPTIINEYFKPARRSYDSLQKCLQKYCDQFRETTFVSVQSNFHPFHNGPEHRYLLTKVGCSVKEIEKEAASAKYMTVVLDDGSYDENTKYYELDLFGQHKEISRLNCHPNLQIVTLEKI